ncbi:MAG: TPM domain-containing protein [Betaproteobacteria bacterium]
MPPFTFFLGIMRQTVLAALLSLLPAMAFCGAGQPSDNPLLSESGRGISRISDPHGWLRHEDRAALEDRLGEFWNRTGLKVSILVDSSSNAWESLESFSKRIAEAWGLSGTSGQPGGVLLVVDPQAKQAGLSVSSELMTDFPSGSIDRIINGNINPMLRRGELAGGITEGFERIAAFLEQPYRINTSLFARGYGAVASFGLFFAGMMLKRRWGPIRSSMAAALSFGTLVCFDGFTLGFSWFEVLFCAALSSTFLGLFVWIGLGDDIPADTAK